MSIVAKGGEKSSSFPSVPVGVHKARCIKVIDLGTQKMSLKERYLGNHNYWLFGKYQNKLMTHPSH